MAAEVVAMITKLIRKEENNEMLPPEPTAVEVVPCNPPPTGLLILPQPVGPNDQKDENAVVLRVGTTLVDDGSQSEMAIHIRTLLATPPIPVFVRADVLRKLLRKEKIKQYAAEAAVKGAAEGAKYAGVPGANAMGEAGGDALDKYFDRVAERAEEHKMRYYETHRLPPYPYEVSVQGVETLSDVDEKGKSKTFNYYAIYTHFPTSLVRTVETRISLAAKYGRKTRFMGTAFPVQSAYTVRYKRYTDFTDLDVLVTTMLPTALFDDDTMPSLPKPMPTFMNHQKPSYVQGRIADLNFYLVSLNHIHHSPELRELLEQWLNEGVGMSAKDFHERQKGQRGTYTNSKK